jgi:hypothetical protein
MTVTYVVKMKCFDSYFTVYYCRLRKEDRRAKEREVDTFCSTPLESCPVLVVKLHA